MPCLTHPEVEATGRCAGCAESLCGNCLVEVAGERYCARCKSMAAKRRPVVDSRMSLCAEAKSALVCSLIGILWLSVILGPMAIITGFKARRRVSEDPSLTGSGLAAAAIVIGAIVTLLAIINLATRAK
jgi:hypothetical protein